MRNCLKIKLLVFTSFMIQFFGGIVFLSIFCSYIVINCNFERSVTWFPWQRVCLRVVLGLKSALKQCSCTATEMIPTIEMIPAIEMIPSHHRNDPHHRNDTGGHHRNDPRNIENGIKGTRKTGQQFSACFLFIYIASFLRCVIYLLPHFILQ